MRKFLLLLLMGGLSAGCYIDDRSSSSSVNGAGATREPDAADLSPEEMEEQASAEQQEWDAIRWHTGSGPSAKGARRVMTLDGEITTDGRFVRFSWDRYPWGGNNALGHFFVWDGTRWVGGKFEWITPPGQGMKTLSNIRGGYNGLRPPSRGTPVAFAWTSADGRERSNLVKDTWR